MKWLFILAVWVFASYLTMAIWANKGIPKSISDTFYVFGGEGEHGYLFTFAMWLSAIPLLISWLSITSDVWKFLPFISCGAMCFVGAACAFKQTLTKTVHYTSAFTWAAAATAWNLIYGNWQIILWCIMGSLICMGINGLKNKTFWFEMACVTSMICGIGRYVF